MTSAITHLNFRKNVDYCATHSQSSWSISVFGEGNEKKELYYLTIPDYYFLNGSTKISYLENSNNSLKNVIKSKNNYKDFLSPRFKRNFG